MRPSFPLVEMTGDLQTNVRMVLTIMFYTLISMHPLVQVERSLPEVFGE
jgi:hypothetical protein